ncbi:RND transporter [Roseicyclus amphidinii]|uniref:RND transporter n=1 Tax=Roseicyclus amphidinii TaxID=3034232 RepID=UPI0024E14389|nr:RND transporter [Roseicyclus sp. Amp-Y-6]
MTLIRRLLDGLPLSVLVIASLTLGLAPFTPEPHIWEKLKMLTAGTLTQPIDIFDLAMHGLPWLLLILKLTVGRPARG